MEILIAVETLVLVLLCALVAGLLRSHAVVLRRLHELGAGVGDPSDRTTGVTSPVDFRVRPGTPSPPDRDGLPDGHDIAGVGLRDDVLALRVVGAEHDTLLAFLSSTCLTCGRFWEAFADLDSLRLPEGVRLVIVTKGAHEESPTAIAGVAPRGATLVMSSEAWTDYGVPGSPYFTLVHGPTGMVRGEGTGPDWPQVASLLAQATGDLTIASDRASARLSKPMADAEREAAVDRELMSAGILPGDPSLYQTTQEPPPAAGELSADRSTTKG